MTHKVTILCDDQYILTESCELGITIPDVMEFQNEDS